MDRRSFLGFGTGVAVGAIATTLGHRLSSTVGLDRAVQERDFSVVGQRFLQARAQEKGLIFGSATGDRAIMQDADFAQRFVQECAILVPENELKWYRLSPTPTTYEFDRADALIHFAQSHNLMVRGHTLVWHQGLPPWFAETVNASNAERFLTEHIETVAARYAGQLHSWDVVNEAIMPEQDHPRGLRHTPWLDFLGEDYIEKAFRLAHEVDPQALLFYNDFGLDFATAANGRKRLAVLQLLERLLDKGVPIHGLGTQSHLNGTELAHIDAGILRQFFGQVARLGLKILVTELDVIDQELPPDIALRDRYVAACYEDYLTAMLEEAAVIGVITWGLSDRFSWLADHKPRRDGLSVRPLPLDQLYQPKLAWNGIARAIASAPPRQPSCC